MTKIINLFGGPNTGKSTTAAELFAIMKKGGASVELVNEYAKEMVWEQRSNVLDDQLYILAKQNRKISRLLGKVNYVITDSPLLLSLVYLTTGQSAFSYLVKELFDYYDNLNFFLPRNDTFVYDCAGRTQASVEEARGADQKLEYYLPKDRFNLTIDRGYTEQILEYVTWS